MQYFVFQYRSTPHCSTKQSPAKLLMGRELRGKLPSLPEIHSDALESAKNNDRIRKGKAKIYYDKRFKTKLSDIKEGDMVLLKQRGRNKLTTKFDITPHKVVERRGSAVILEKNGSQIMRNVSAVKKIPIVHNQKSTDVLSPSTKQPEDDAEESDLEFDVPDVPVCYPRPQFPHSSRRPQRIRQPPPRLRDFVRQLHE